MSALETVCDKYDLWYDSKQAQAELSTMLKELKKHEDKEQGKTQYEVPHSINHKATQNKNNTRTTALERSVA